MPEVPRHGLGQTIVHYGKVWVGACALTLAFFLVLPLIQAITKKPPPDTTLRSADIGNLPPPPEAPPEPEPEEEQEPEEPPPPVDDAPPMDLADLELALNPGGGSGGWATADFSMKFNALSGSAGMSDLLSLASVEQEPRLLQPVSPSLNAAQRRATPGKVYILCVVNERGKVENPKVDDSTNPALEAPALAAIKKWRFEPAKRAGKPVPYRIRQPITFPKM